MAARKIAAKLASSPPSKELLRKRKVLSDLRAILRNVRMWPTASLPDSDFKRYIIDQYRANRDVQDKEALRSLRQHARDTVFMLTNIDRQKEIALLLSGEKAPSRELVKLAAARCGLAIPESADLQAIQDSGDFHKGYSAQRQPWRPDTKGSLTSKYKKRLEKVLGPEDSE